MLRAFSIVLFLFSCIVYCAAQLNSPIMPGARGLAMGGTGLNAQDVHAAWANPAGLAGVEELGFGFYGEQRFSLTELRQISATAALTAGKNAGMALVIGYFGFEAYNEQRVGVAYGRKLSDNINLGAQVFVLSTRIPEYGNKTLMSFELGIQGKISPEVSLAAKVINPLRIELIPDEYLPSVMSLGIQYRPGKEVLILAEAEKDALLPMRVRVGVEYGLFDVLDLRVGVATGETQLSFGFGYKIKDQWQLNLAAAYHQFLGFTPGIGLVYR